MDSTFITSFYRRLKKLAIISCMFYVGCCIAETTYDLYGVSQHPGGSGFKENGQFRLYNSKNWGLGISRKLSGSINFITGIVENSYYRQSTYAGTELLKKRRITFGSPLKLTYGLRVFYITGYDDTPLNADKYQKAGFFQAGLEHKKTRLTIGFNSAVSILYFSYTP